MKRLIGFKSRFLAGIVILFAILSISNSCTKDTMSDVYGTVSGTKGSGGPGINEVWIQGMAFIPASISVTVGTTITWTNKDAVVHTVTSNNGLFESGAISSSGTFSYTFPTAGTYMYYCTIHPLMKAEVVATAPAY